MTRTGSPRIVGYAALVAVGLIGALALRRPELAVVAAPFALILAIGLRTAREPGVSVELALSTDRALEGTAIETVLEAAAERSVDRLEVLVELPAEMDVADGSRAHAVRLRAGERHELPLSVRCTRWGVFDVGRVEVRARDALRLVTWEARFEQFHRVKAYPTPLTLQQLLAPLETQAFSGSEVARVKSDGVEIVPLAFRLDEAAGFVVDAPFAGLPEMRLELHGTLVVQRPAALDGHDVQPPPFDAGIKVKLRGPGVRMPRLQEIRGVQEHEGAIAGTHQLFCGGCPGGCTVEAPAAINILLAGEARAVARIGLEVGH